MGADACTPDVAPSGNATRFSLPSNAEVLWKPPGTAKRCKDAEGMGVRRAAGHALLGIRWDGPRTQVGPGTEEGFSVMD